MSAVETTVFEVTTTGQEFTIPGDWTVESIVSTYGPSISGLAGMSNTVSTEGNTKTIRFSPRTGTKG